MTHEVAVLPIEDVRTLAAELKAAEATAMEFKAFADEEQIFAKYAYFS